jgi:hypothetical protein
VKLTRLPHRHPTADLHCELFTRIRAAMRGERGQRAWGGHGLTGVCGVWWARGRAREGGGGRSARGTRGRFGGLVRW